MPILTIYLTVRTFRNSPLPEVGLHFPHPQMRALRLYTKFFGLRGAEQKCQKNYVYNEILYFISNSETQCCQIKICLNRDVKGKTIEKISNSF